MPSSAIPTESTPMCERVARNVKLLRRARNMSTQDLSVQLSLGGMYMPTQVLRKLERGLRRKISVDELFALADVFHVSAHTLATMEMELSVTGDVEGIR